MRIKTVFENAVSRLKQAGIPEPELEVSLLLSHVLKMRRTDVLLAGEQVLDGAQQALFAEKISRRLAAEPLAYITGEKEFWSLPFMVSKDVLIPRPETELLLEKALIKLKRAAARTTRTLRVLDLGTGSGVIAIVLALELGDVQVTAVDRSCRALKVAQQNAKHHGVADTINFINSNWFKAISAAAEFDAVITNPPYIARQMLCGPFARTAGFLQPEVGDFEPHLALDGGEKGLREIKKIAAELAGYLKPGAWFFMEIGAEQAHEVIDIFNKESVYGSIEIYSDYAGLNRVFQARRS